VEQQGDKQRSAHPLGIALNVELKSHQYSLSQGKDVLIEKQRPMEFHGPLMFKRCYS
jgi:hypothetical protein